MVLAVGLRQLWRPRASISASKALLYAVIGGVLIIGATAIAQIIKNLVNAFAN